MDPRRVVSRRHSHLRFGLLTYVVDPGRQDWGGSRKGGLGLTRCESRNGKARRSSEQEGSLKVDPESGWH